MRPADITTPELAQAAIERLSKWRMHFAGWLLGSRPITDPQAQWVRDNTDKVLLLRAELNAITRVLLDKGIVSREDFTIAVGVEAQALINAYEERWPGITTTDTGLSYDVQKLAAAGWMKGWLP